MHSNRSSPGALVGGLLLIAFGLLSLSLRLLHFVDWDLLWPLIVIGFGTFFEMIFSSSSHTLFPLLLIGLGVYVWKRAGLFGAKDKHPTDSFHLIK